MSFQRDGGCQCGAVRYRVSAEPLRLSMCHCTQCQHQSGSAFGMSLIVADTAFELLQGSLKTWTRSSDSGRMVACSFCPECGTRIHHKADSYKGYTNVKPGTLDDTSWLEPTISIWMSSKQPWVVVPEGITLEERQP
jgi:hypothetical protein